MLFRTCRGLRIGGLALLVAALISTAALAAVPAAGHWIGKVVKGQAVSGSAGKPIFTVSGGRVRKFSIRGIGAYCFSGYSVVSVYVPSASIHNGSFATTFHPVKNANIKLTGRFVSATKATGTVTGSGYACDYTIGFVAHRG